MLVLVLVLLSPPARRQHLIFVLACYPVSSKGPDFLAAPAPSTFSSNTAQFDAPAGPTLPRPRRRQNQKGVFC